MTRSPPILCILCAVLCAACARLRPPAAAARPPKTAIPHARVHFATGSDRVAFRERRLVAENARWLLAHPEATAVLDGHADERGSGAFNLELGDRRARGVKALLGRAGLDGGRSIVVSSGEGRPVDPGHRPAAWRKNRRVEFAVP